MTRRLVAITGGAGFIGSRLADWHLRNGDRVRVLTRSERPTIPEGVEVHVGDLRQAGDHLTGFVDGADVVYHCAGEVRDEPVMHDVHVSGTANLIESSLGRIGRWVQLSSVGALGPYRHGDVTEESDAHPVGTYEITKAKADELVLANMGQDLQATILRPSIVFGPGMPNASLGQLITLVDRRLFFYVGPKGASANYVPVENVIDAMVLCGHSPKAPGEVFNLSDWATLEDFVAAIADGLGRPRPSLRLPETPVRAATRALSGVPGFPLTTTRIDALTNRSHYPDEKISSLLGFRHNVPVLEGIRSLAAQRRTS